MMRPHEPSGHVRFARSQMGHAGVDMVPRQRGAPSLVKRSLVVGIELAEIVKGCGVNDRARQSRPYGGVTMVGHHRLGAHSSTLHHATDVSRVGLRILTPPGRGMRERLIGHRSDRTGGRPVLDTQILE